LIDPSYTLNGTHIVGILGNQVAGVLRFNLAMGFLLFLFAFQGNDPGLGQNKAVLGYTGFQGLQALLKDLQIVALSHTSYTSSRNENMPFFRSPLQARDWP